MEFPPLRHGPVAHALTAWLGASLILNALLVVPARAADTLSLAAAQQMALQRSRGLAAQDAAATASQGVVSENGKNRTLSTAKKLVMDRHATVAGRACPLLSCP